MSNNNSNSTNLITVAIEKFFGPLVKITSDLPAPLAYTGSVIIALLVITLLGAVLPENLIWLIGVLVVVSLGVFIYADNSKRQGKKGKSESLSTKKPDFIYVSVIVYEKENLTELIEDAEVVLVLDTVDKDTTNKDGEATFRIPGSQIGKDFTINARKAGYDSEQPQTLIVKENDFRVLIPLKTSGAKQFEELPGNAGVYQKAYRDFKKVVDTMSKNGFTQDTAKILQSARTDAENRHFQKDPLPQYVKQLKDEIDQLFSDMLQIVLEKPATPYTEDVVQVIHVGRSNAFYTLDNPDGEAA